MIVSDLPDDMLNLIMTLMPGRYSIKNCRARMVVCGTRDSRTAAERIAASRIQLWYLLLSRWRQLSIYIQGNLARTFSAPASYVAHFQTAIETAGPLDWRKRHRFVAGLEGLPSIPSNCIYYAPFVPDGACRVCLGRSDSHPFTERLIMRYIKPW